MAGRIVVVGLGPAGADLVTTGTRAAIDATRVRFVRTTRHPAAPVVAPATSFDDVYEAEGTFDDVYRRIAERLLAAATEHGEVLYAVPGSPRVLERSVDHLVAAAAEPGADVEVEVLPALSFLDLAWVRLGVDPLEAGARLVDGHRFVAQAAGERGPLLVAHVHNQRVLSDIKLAADVDDDVRVTVLQRLGSPDEAIAEVAWSELDREVAADHLTALWIPELAEPVAAEVARFAELVTTLRESCPWDREQTHHSLTPYLLEEAYEVIDVIDGLPADAPGTDPAYARLEDELGDLLYQVVFHARLASEVGAFTLADVARGIHDKLVRRHPHVFAGASSELDEVNRRWDEIKQAERAERAAQGVSGPMDDIPAALPAVLYAAKVLRRAAAAGQPWTPGETGDLGDRLLALVAEGMVGGVDPESALRHAATRVRDTVV
jgi:tetrapyrrole methylase family protein/MazG family protein